MFRDKLAADEDLTDWSECNEASFSPEQLIGEFSGRITLLLITLWLKYARAKLASTGVFDRYVGMISDPRGLSWISEVAILQLLAENLTGLTGATLLPIPDLLGTAERERVPVIRSRICRCPFTVGLPGRARFVFHRLGQRLIGYIAKDLKQALLRLL